jgi:hypothetical protein
MQLATALPEQLSGWFPVAMVDEGRRTVPPSL